LRLSEKKITINISGGFGYNEYLGNSYSNRTNVFTDSTNYFNTVGNSNSNNHRPNARFNLDYDLDKRNIVNFTVQYNANDAGSANLPSTRISTGYKKFINSAIAIPVLSMRSHNPVLILPIRTRVKTQKKVSFYPVVITSMSMTMKEIIFNSI
jgi:hypothetical protein